MRLRLLLVSFALAAWSPWVTAQTVNVNQTTVGQAPGGPPRDGRAPAQVGTASVKGRVIAADTGRPLRRARISFSAPELNGDNRSTSTNADGRYEIKDLPAGRYTISVNRSGYLQLRYGQRRPFEAGKPLQLSDRQTVDNVNFTLPRMGLITGRVYDETGDPISGVRVFAMRSVYFEGKRRLVPVATGPLATTDDAGQYRILGLAPGSYFVMADVRETWTVTEGDVEQVLGYAPTYFPGTLGVSDARRVTVAVGQEMSNTDLALIPGRAMTVSGAAFDSQGRPLAGRRVSLGQEWRGPGFGMVMMGGNGATVNADGSFVMKSVAPGPYTLSVQTAVDVAGSSIQESASAQIVVGEAPVDNISLQTSAGWSASGQITTETGAVPTLSRDRVRITSNPVADAAGARVSPTMAGPGQRNPDSGRVREDWTFAVTGVFGAAQIRASLPDTWMVKQLLHDGRDVTDTVFEMKSGESVSGLQIVLTDRVNSINGQLADDKGVPILDGSIIAFSTDAEKWSEDSRFVRSVRPDQDGKYSVRGLPAGEYFVVAVDYVEEGMWNDPEFLQSLRPHSQKVSLGAADAQTVSLKLITP